MNQYYCSQDEATRIVDAKLHTLNCKIGRARARAKCAETLQEKIAAKLEEKNLREELTNAHRRYFDDIDTLSEELEKTRAQQPTPERTGRDTP